MCLKVNQVPQRDNVRDLEPSTTECDLIWKEGLKRRSQDEVIMGYLIQYDLCPHIENNEKKKEEIGHSDRHGKREDCKWM